MDYQRIAGRLQQRIAEITAEYEGRLAIEADQYERKIEELEKQLGNKKGADGGVVSEASDTAPSS